MMPRVTGGYLAVRVPDSALWPVERVLSQWYPLVVFVVGSFALAPQVLPTVQDLGHWDWLYVSGLVTWLAALPLALRLPNKLTETLVRLVNRKVLVGGPPLPGFLEWLHRSARWSGLVGALVTVIAIVLSFVFVTSSRSTSWWFLVVLEAVAAVPVGLFIGRAADYGLLGMRLTKAGFALRPDPDHLDGAAGLQPIGALFFHSASLLAIPGVFLAGWWVLFPIFGGSRWREPYAVMLLIVVAAAIMVFLLPMVTFHRLMVRRKTELFAEADALTELAARAAAGSEVDEKWQKRYSAIESMPTWPVDAKMRRRFGIRNIVLLLPVAAQIIGSSQGTRDLLDAVRKVFTG